MPGRNQINGGAQFFIVIIVGQGLIAPCLFLLDLRRSEPEQKEVLRPDLLAYLDVGPSMVPRVNAPFSENSILPVPEASLPALYNLACDGLLSERFDVLGTARRSISTEA